jgi:L-aspartate oxidase
MEQVKTDILIIGAGLAGLTAALSAADKYRVIIAFGVPEHSASYWAQGGVAASYYPDTPDSHVQDTVNAGGGLCDLSVVQSLCEQAASQIDWLLARGVSFCLNDKKKFDLVREGGHQVARVVHANDRTGRSIVKNLWAACLAHPKIEMLDHTHCVDLIKVNEVVSGATLQQGHRLLQVLAGATVLATGGASGLFAAVTHTAPLMGVGAALAWQVGVPLMDLEMIQFHPTCVLIDGYPPLLLTEVMRGKGAHVVNDQHERFLLDAHPKGELAPRDVVSRRMQQEMSHQDRPHVWMSMKHMSPQALSYFPENIRALKQRGLDPIKDLIPIQPAAHYTCGGIQASLAGQTTVPGLYALGEVACTGVHGANRLASNSLLECLVMGRTFAEQVSLVKLRKQAIKQGDHLQPAQSSDLKRLQQLMHQSMHVIRQSDQLNIALSAIEDWCDQPTGSSMRYHLDLCRLMLKSALFRQESRGGHFRQDFPKTSSAWDGLHTKVVGEKILRSSIHA